MAVPAKPVYAAMNYTDPKTGILSAGGQQALAQWHSAINSIPVSVSGEQAQGAGTEWNLSRTPAAGVNAVGLGPNGPVLLTPGNGQPWNFTLQGNRIVTEQAFEGVIASYEYTQG